MPNKTLDVAHELPSGDEMRLAGGAKANEPSTMNYEPRGFWPRLGSRQLIALLAIVAFGLLVFVFVGNFLQKGRGGGQEISSASREEAKNKVLQIVAGIKLGKDEGENSQHFQAIKFALEGKNDNFRTAARDLKIACQEQVSTAADKARLKRAFDEILTQVPDDVIKQDKSYYSEKDATRSAYVWYCPA